MEEISFSSTPTVPGPGRPLERARQDRAASSRSRFGPRGGLSLRTAIAKCRLLNPREPERVHYRGTEWRRKNHVCAGISAEVCGLPKFHQCRHDRTGLVALLS